MEIKLISDHQLPLEVVKDWYSSVKNYGPKGIIRSVQKKTDSGYKEVCLESKKVGSKYEYIINLTRNIEEEEVDDIIDSFDYSGDYIVETPSEHHEAVELSSDNYDHICTQLAKYRHDKWVTDRIADGWRYGPNMSIANKTNPLLRPWHELSDDHKNIDTNEPQQIIDMLTDNGYYVIDRHQLEGIKSLFKI